MSQPLLPSVTPAAGYTSKFGIALDPRKPACEAMRRILRFLHEAILRNEAGAIEGLDAEFLHDLRVAVRRTRSALGRVKGVFRRRETRHFRREFAWLGRVTGPTRDLDVCLLKLPVYAAVLPAETRLDLEPLSELLRERRASAQAELVRAFRSARYRRLRDGWRDFVGDATAPGPGPQRADRPVFEVASESIARAHRRVLERGSRIDRQSPAADLHRLRIECKKLRYLLEFFRSLYSPEKLERVIRGLKRLQDNLGDFNDFGVEQKILGRLSAELAAEGPSRAATVAAAGRLVRELANGKARERAAFGTRFQDFSGSRTTELLRALVRGDSS